MLWVTNHLFGTLVHGIESLSILMLFIELIQVYRVYQHHVTFISVLISDKIFGGHVSFNFVVCFSFCFLN
jgi:hypothetical protein